MPPGPKQSLCIVETRETYWLPGVIQNAVREFSGWDLYIAAPASVLRWILGIFSSKDVKPIVLDNFTYSVDTFNNVMFASDFWDAIQTEYVMMFQCDTVFVQGAAANLPTTGRDFYGAACGTLDDDFVINGGLSYRKVSAFRNACRLLTDDDKKLPEDVAYTRLMRRNGMNLPTVTECMRFAIESFGNPSTVVGIHGTDKMYCPRGLLVAALGFRSKKLYDCISYDGEPILETRLTMLGKVVDYFVIVEARVTHSGNPKPLRFDPDKFAKWMPKIKYVVIDEFPDPPEHTALWTDRHPECWWREKYQRDLALKHVMEEDSVVICADVDEIPDPASLGGVDMLDRVVHLDMAFLVHTPRWQKKEQWTRAFVAPLDVVRGKSLTDIRVGQVSAVLPCAGWHCSSFFDVESQIRKVQNFAHREFSEEIDPDVIKKRFETGKDPYGRGPEFDCFRTGAHAFLEFVSV